MRRRDFIKAIVGSPVAWPLAARAQQLDQMRLIGVLMGYTESDRAAQSWLAAFRGGLTKLGWTEGSNLRIELRWSANDPAGTLGGKWVGLLKEIAPRTLRMALLFNPATAVPLQYSLPSIQAAAFSLAVQVNAAPVHAKDEIEGVIAAQGGDPGGGLLVMPDVSNDVNRELIIALAARYSVPAVYFNRFFSELGGLISYGDVRSEQFRLAAGYIDRILKGEKPADLPLQVPTKFELVINLKTAKALGLEVPPTLLARADEVIE